MKVRGSWGMLGNQQIGNDYYPYINTYATNAKYPFDNKVSGGAVQTEIKSRIFLGKRLLLGVQL